MTENTLLEKRARSWLPQLLALGTCLCLVSLARISANANQEDEDADFPLLTDAREWVDSMAAAEDTAEFLRLYNAGLRERYHVRSFVFSKGENVSIGRSGEIWWNRQPLELRYWTDPDEPQEVVELQEPTCLLVNNESRDVRILESDELQDATTFVIVKDGAIVTIDFDSKTMHWFQVPVSDEQ